MILRIATRQTPEEELFAWRSRVRQRAEEMVKAEAEVRRMERKLASLPGNKVFVQMLDEAERWLRKATHSYESHKKVLDEMLERQD